MKQTKTQTLVECAILIAIATVLSLFKLVDLPYGGSVTAASMLPLVLISYRHGLLRGVTAGLVYGVIQQLLGLNTLAWVTTWQSVVAVIVLDYVVAFGVTGLGGIFKNRIKSQALSLTAGVMLICLLRYGCHVIAGCTVWAGLSIPTSAALIYSIGYNATYMIPETVVLMLAVFYIGVNLDLEKRIPTPTVREKLSVGSSVLVACAGLCVLATLIADTVLIFAKLQNAESGSFDITGLKEVAWGTVGIITLCGVAVCIVLSLISRKIAAKA
jgi:thiamine transporter